MISRLSSAAALLIVLGASAQAADLAPQGGFTDTYDWSGFYIGVNGGFGWQDNTIDYSFTGSIPTYVSAPVGFLPTTVTTSASGAQGGMQFGYNAQAGSFVYGLEADAIVFAGKGVSTFTATDTLFATFGQSISASTTTETPWAGSLRVRLGFTDDRFLGYLTAGLAIGRTETQSDVSYFADTIFFTPPSLYRWSTSGSSINIGWAAGAGIEYAFASNVIARVEYMYYDLGNNSATLPDATFSGFSGALQQSNSINTVRIGLGYKFQ